MQDRSKDHIGARKTVTPTKVEASHGRISAPSNKRSFVLPSSSDLQNHVTTRGHQMDRLLSLQEAAELIGMSTRWIRRRFADGRLQRVKLGRSTRVRLSDIAQIIERGMA